MSNRRDNISLIRELAASEGGVFTSALARSFGISKHALSHASRTGLLERVAHGAYRMCTSIDDGFDALRASYKLTAPGKWTYDRIREFDGIAVAGVTAACLHEIGNFHANPYVIAVSKRFNSRNTQVRYTVRHLKSVDVVWKKGLPVLSVEATLGSLVADHEDQSLVADCFIDAIRKYGATELTANSLKGRIGEARYDFLMEAAISALPDGYSIRVVDERGHLAIMSREEAGK